MGPLLGRFSSLRYLDDRDERRHYFVMHLDGWRIDVSLWSSGMPPFVESFQTELIARLTGELRITILRRRGGGGRFPPPPTPALGQEVARVRELEGAILEPTAHVAELVAEVRDDVVAERLDVLACR
jgi:hypothetical protein